MGNASCCVLPVAGTEAEAAVGSPKASVFAPEDLREVGSDSGKAEGAEPGPHGDDNGDTQEPGAQAESNPDEGEKEEPTPRGDASNPFDEIADDKVVEAAVEKAGGLMALERYDVRQAEAVLAQAVASLEARVGRV